MRRHASVLPACSALPAFITSTLASIPGLCGSSTQPIGFFSSGGFGFGFVAATRVGGDGFAGATSATGEGAASTGTTTIWVGAGDGGGGAAAAAGRAGELVIASCHTTMLAAIVAAAARYGQRRFGCRAATSACIDG
jgi:hypothetical protein